MNDEFLSLLAQAQQDPQPPTARRSTTGVAESQKRGPRQFTVGETTVDQGAGLMSPSERAALRRANDQGIPLPRRIEIVSSDQYESGLRGRYRSDRGGKIQLMTARGTDPSVFDNRRRNLPYMFGQTPVQEDPSSQLAGGRTQGVQTLVHELGHHLQANTKGERRPNALATSDGVFVPPYKQNAITVGAGEAEADVMAGALRQVLFNQEGNEGLPTRIGLVSTPTYNRNGYSYDTVPTEKVLGQYRKWIQNQSQ